ncbi:uncharacterized protein LOC127874757 isoform X2 [Dreissena polymorpha]|nr:uncharacterized protein LOC127874757 isoform X2 [Dreissena polymorpha]XP_052275316.1 uncharacterized protein LOC127874757 isoform X2 [Dreissena polymorpha]
MASEGSSGRRAIDLPSFNLSNYINIGEGQTAKDLLEQLKNKGTIVPVKNERPQGQPMTNGTSKGKGIRQVARQKSAGLNSKLATQIMEGPKLSIKVPNEYSRFRYESEKTKIKNGREITIRMIQKNSVFWKLRLLTIMALLR